jgi:hypothetical protein
MAIAAGKTGPIYENMWLFLQMPESLHFQRRRDLEYSVSVMPVCFLNTEEK